MTEFLLYLAGGISGLSYQESVDWRQQVISKLPAHIIGISPMRGKNYLSGEGKIKGSYELHPLSSQRGIMTRDHFDVRRSHAILANLLGASKVSIGTVMEIAWGHSLQKPVILAMEDENVHNHPMIREASGFVVPSLDDAITIAIAVLSPTYPFK